MNIISATNPRWADDAQTIISLDVEFEGLGVLPFSAQANDVEAHGRALFAQAVAGDFGPVLPKPPKPLAEVKADKLAQLDALRKNAINTLSPVTVGGKQYPANTEYREIVSNLARRSAAARPLPASLRDAGGVAVALNAALVTQIDDAITAAIQGQWDRYWGKVDAVQAAATAAQVDAVTW